MSLLGLAYEQPDDYGTQRDRHINGRNRGGLLCVRVELRQNQFVTAYLANGPHKLRVSNECNALSMGMRKALDIDANGQDQEYLTEVGFWGQYRMWRVK